MSGTQRASLLAVFAHPDDELFHAGILAHLGERGVRVTLACATGGEAGKTHPSLGAVQDLGAVRTDELRLACRYLGIEPPVLLGFHDSGRKQHQRHGDSRALANVDMLEVEAAIRAVIDEVRPQVLVTFDPHGGYYHPDHMAVHRAATAAFFSSGVLGADGPQRLFYVAMRRDVFRTLAERSRGRGILDGLDPDVFSVAPETIAVSFDATPYLERKYLVLAAHRSQFGLTPELLRKPPADVAGMLEAFRPVFEREAFVMGGIRGPVPAWPLGSFFDGLESTGLHGQASDHAEVLPGGR